MLRDDMRGFLVVGTLRGEVLCRTRTLMSSSIDARFPPIKNRILYRDLCGDIPIRMGPAHDIQSKLGMLRIWLNCANMCKA